MPNLEPTYLRYIYDSLNKGSLKAENAAALPHGFIGLYEKEFTQRTPAEERENSLKYLSIWALLKEPVSADLAAAILGVDEQLMKNLVDRYSNWFNSSESGKFQLYHERIKVYLLSKINDSLIEENTESIICFCKQIFEKPNDYKNEFIEFSLKNYTSYLYDFTFFKPAYYQEIKIYCLETKFIEMNLIYLNSLKYFILSIEYGLKKAIQINNEDDFFLFLEEREKMKSLIFDKLKSYFEYQLKDFVLYFLNMGLKRDEIFFKQYFLLTLFKLSNLIKENQISQGDLDIVFKGIIKKEYNVYFEDLTHIGAKKFWVNLFSLLENKGIDYSIVLEHLPTDFNVDSPYDINHHSKNIQLAFDSLKDSSVASFIKENLTNNTESKNHSFYFSSIDDPIYFQDKLIELYEFASSKGNTNILINAITPTTSKIHLSELMTLLTNQVLSIKRKNQISILNDVLHNNFKINYFKFIDRLNILLDGYLKLRKINSLKELLKSLDRNSFEHYLEYCFVYYIERNDISSLNELLSIEISMTSSTKPEEVKILQKINYHFAENMLLNSKSIFQLKGLKEKLSDQQHKTIKLQAVFFEKIKASNEDDFFTVIKDFFSNYDVKNKRLNSFSKSTFEKLNLSNVKLKEELLNEAKSRIQSVFYNSINNDIEAKGVNELIENLLEVDNKIKSILSAIEEKWNYNSGISEDEYFNYKTQIKILEDESLKLQQVTINQNPTDVALLLKNEIKGLKELLPVEYLVHYIDEIEHLFSEKLMISNKIGELRSVQIKSQLDPILKALLSKIASSLKKSNNLIYLYTLAHYNYFKTISTFLSASLVKSGLDEKIVQFFRAVPSVKVIMVLMSDFDFKKELYEILKSGILSKFNIVIIQNYYRDKLLNPDDYINDLRYIKEEDLFEAYYYLGFTICLSSLTHSLIGSLDKLYVKDFIRGLLDNIITNKLDMKKHLKFLFFHLHSIPDLSDELIDEILLHEKFIKGVDLSYFPYLNSKIDSVYTENILINNE